MTCLHVLAVRRLPHRLQVGAGREVAARAGEDREADLGLASTYVEPVGEAHEHVGAEGVARLGPVHREDHDVTVALDGQCFVLRSSSSGIRAPRVVGADRN